MKFEGLIAEEVWTDGHGIERPSYRWKFVRREPPGGLYASGHEPSFREAELAIRAHARAFGARLLERRDERTLVFER